MIGFAESEFNLNKRGEDGCTVKDHLLAAWNATGQKPQALEDAPTIPEGVEPVWVWFLELHSTRGSNGMGANPISYQELAAWSALTRTTLSPWEVKMLRLIDQEYLKANV